MGNFTDFIAAVSGITVTGVTRQYTSPPLSLNTADLPASWPEIPTGTANRISFCEGSGKWTEVNLRFVVAFEAVGQSRQPENYAGTIELMDNIRDAFCSLSPRPGKGRFDWEMTMEIIAVAENTYWASVVNITGIL